MIRSVFWGSTAISTLVIAIGGISPAAAQTATATQPATTVAEAASDSTNSDITVTARKRNERLLDVPISIQAFTRADIQAAQITDIRDVAERAGFTILSQVSTGAGGRAQGNLVFRGLQNVSFTTNQQSSGAAFIDGIFVSNAIQSLNTSDVERVEVLKGPQNAYFGRSTFGGAVNFITRKPSDRLEGEINLTQTFRGSFTGDASIEGPIIPGLLSGRILAFGNSKVADYKATDGGDLGAESTYGGAITLYATPAPNLWFRARGSYQRDNDSSADQAYIPARLYGSGCAGKTFQGTDASGNPVPYTLNKPYFCNGLPSFSALEAANPHFIDANTILPANFAAALANNLPGNPVSFLNETPKLNHSGLIRDVYRASFQGGYTFDTGGSLALNVGYNESRSTFAFDIDHTNLNYFFNAFAAIDRDLTADFRIASNPLKRLRFLLGASYFYSRNASDRLDDNIVFGLAPSRSSLFVDARNQTPSIYGSVDFDLLPWLTLSADGRYEQEKDYNYDKNHVRYQQTFKKFLPRGIIKFHPGHDLDIYASYSEGVQPATLNTTYISATPAQRAYINTIDSSQSVFSVQPSSKNYEIGIKQKLFGGRVSYSLAAYQIEWHNALQTAFIANPPACNTLVPVGQNGTPASCPLAASGSSLLFGNDARVRGIEFSTSVQATRDIDFGLSLDYKDPIWKSYHNSSYASSFTGTSLATGVQYFDGNHLARVPNITGVFSPAFHHPINDRVNFYARGDAIYTGKAWDSDLNIFKTPDFVRVNARIGLEWRNSTIEFFSTNLFKDKHFDAVSLVADVSELSFTQRGVLVNTPPPREFGLRLHYKFR
jgi:iron complex outermembrane receptor protein